MKQLFFKCASRLVVFSFFAVLALVGFTVGPGVKSAIAAEGTCSCDAVVSAGLLLPNETFNQYCASVAQCVCSDGAATCSGDFDSSKVECDNASKDPWAFLEKQMSMDLGQAKIVLNANQVSCTFKPGPPKCWCSDGKSCAMLGAIASQKKCEDLCWDDKTKFKAKWYDSFDHGKDPLCAGGVKESSPPDAENGSSSSTPAGTTGGGAAVQLYNPLGGVTSLQDLIGRAIRAVLGIVGALALLMFVYGGIIWLTSGGSEKRIEQGKKILMNATIGLLIIFFSYTIINVFLGIFAGSVSVTLAPVISLFG